jgi:outer membrane protein assembly factor BamD
LRGDVEQYPNFSHADQALWDAADSLSKMGPRFRQKEGDTLAKIVKDYPLSPYADLAKKKLQSLEMPVPEADPAAVARMKFEQENRTKPGMMHRVLGPLENSPDTSMAAKSGSPTMTNPKATIPATVPSAAAQSGITDVTAAPVTDPTALERLPDARTKEGTAAPGTTTPAASGATTPATTDAKPDAAAAPASQATSTSTSTSTSTNKNKKNNKKNTKSTKSTSTSTSTSGSSNQ